jgi:hypothetical protein
MTKFEDYLFADLMAEHRPALERLTTPVASTRTRRVPVRRAAWLTGFATAGAAAAGAGVLVLGGGTPAYAVTQHPDGTVTVSLTTSAGIKPANAKLRVLGDPGVLVPVGPGCPSIASLPKPKVTGPVRVSVKGMVRGGTITVDAHGVPAGATMIIAASTPQNGPAQLGGALITGPVPKCVSLPAPPPGGSGGSGGGSGTSNG